VRPTVPAIRAREAALGEGGNHFGYEGAHAPGTHEFFPEWLLLFICPQPARAAAVFQGTPERFPATTEAGDSRCSTVSRSYAPPQQIEKIGHFLRVDAVSHLRQVRKDP
jgi:hypothetical protein